METDLTPYFNMCVARPSLDVISTSVYDGLVIEIFVSYLPIQEDDEVIWDEMMDNKCSKQFRVPRDSFRDDDTTSSKMLVTHMIMSHMKVPICNESNIDEITNCARGLLCESENSDRKTVGMVVNLDLIFRDKDEAREAYKAAARRIEGGEGQIELRLPSIRMENVVFDSESCTKHCVICLEEFSMGSQVSRTGCKHSYHQECILRWLQKSRLCPLCRDTLVND